MKSFTIEIRPKKTAFDPLARALVHELLEAGEPEQEAHVKTERLFRLAGELTKKDATAIAETLLVDPVVETFAISDDGLSARPKKAKKGWILDIWPKPGVTDPVGETIEKGLKDLGYQNGIHATSATRTIFPSIKEKTVVEMLGKKILANELIHDIHIRPIR